MNKHPQEINKLLKSTNDENSGVFRNLTITKTTLFLGEKKKLKHRP